MKYRIAAKHRIAATENPNFPYKATKKNIDFERCQPSDPEERGKKAVATCESFIYRHCIDICCYSITDGVMLIYLIGSVLVGSFIVVFIAHSAGFVTANVNADIRCGTAISFSHNLMSIF